MIHLIKPLTRESPQSLPRASRLTFLPYSPKASNAFDRRSQKPFIDSRLNERKQIALYVTGIRIILTVLRNQESLREKLFILPVCQELSKVRGHLKGNHHRNKYNTLDLPLVVLNSRLRRKQCIFSSVFVARSISVQSDAKRLVHL